jgi:hypothetical protein
MVPIKRNKKGYRRTTDEDGALGVLCMLMVMGELLSGVDQKMGEQEEGLEGAIFMGIQL